MGGLIRAVRVMSHHFTREIVTETRWIAVYICGVIQQDGCEYHPSLEKLRFQASGIPFAEPEAAYEQDDSEDDKNVNPHGIEIGGGTACSDRD